MTPVYACYVTTDELQAGRAVIEERGVSVPMRDGVRLSADVWRQAADQPVPVLICRTPYDKQTAALMAAPAELAAAGFAVVLQDCRAGSGLRGSGPMSSPR